jgi:hypothetical protein
MDMQRIECLRWEGFILPKGTLVVLNTTINGREYVLTTGDVCCVDLVSYTVDLEHKLVYRYELRLHDFNNTSDADMPKVVTTWFRLEEMEAFFSPLENEQAAVA